MGSSCSKDSINQVGFREGFLKVTFEFRAAGYMTFF